jgi:phosphoserine aminotransferase
MPRKFNFYAGPAILPYEVMKKAQDELLDFNGIGLSILEISHRSKDFEQVINNAVDKTRKLLDIPDNYTILFLQGGATQQFGMVPMNLLTGGSADYVNTGSWATKAIKEARLFGDVHVAGSSEDKNFSYIPRDLTLSADARYVHITSNETIGGIQYREFPDTGNVPLIADMSSDIFSRQLDISRFGLIYCGAQKNMGPAGVTLVIIRDDLLEASREDTTTMLNYRKIAAKNSMLNTPPCFAIYMVSLVLDWLEAGGGVRKMEARNEEKAAMLYNLLDNSDFYHPTASPEDRSRMNVTFRLPTEELEKTFIAEAAEFGLIGLKGHRSVGGCRASIYNAMPVEGVEALIGFMENFQKRHR